MRFRRPLILAASALTVLAVGGCTSDKPSTTTAADTGADTAQTAAASAAAGLGNR